MIDRRSLLVSVPFVFFAVACKSQKESRQDSSPDAPLALSAPVDPAFTGCAKSCGLRLGSERTDVRTQPGATLGDVVHCPVSGAVFRIKESSPKREARGKTLWFCCDSCASWFTTHEAEVLAKRGLV
jgi:YHS domain-containing protein